MIEKADDCYFYENSYCILSDNTCDRVCRDGMPAYLDLEFNDHLQIHLRRRENRINRIMKSMSIIISLLALIISFLAFFHSTKAPSQSTKVNKPGVQSLELTSQQTAESIYRDVPKK